VDIINLLAKVKERFKNNFALLTASFFAIPNPESKKIKKP